MVAARVDLPLCRRPDFSIRVVVFMFFYRFSRSICKLVDVGGRSGRRLGVLYPMRAPMGLLVLMLVSLVEVEVVLVPSRESLTPQGSYSWSRGWWMML